MDSTTGTYVVLGPGKKYFGSFQCRDKDAVLQAKNLSNENISLYRLVALIGPTPEPERRVTLFPNAEAQ